MAATAVIATTGLARGAAFTVGADADRMAVPPPTALPLFLLLPCCELIGQQRAERPPRMPLLLPRAGLEEHLIDRRADLLGFEIFWTQSDQEGSRVATK